MGVGIGNFGSIAEFELTVDHVVAGDRSVIHGGVHVRSCQPVPVGRGDPGVEISWEGQIVMTTVSLARRRIEHELGKDPVVLAHPAPLGNPIQVSLALVGQHADGPQTHNHAGLCAVGMCEPRYATAVAHRETGA